ncbi:helix-turn-helix transcriptional regulator [Streptomyces sp. HUAS 31]|uniref:helix-turn-helix domain-containing protein n=1 Tax=Streptomyces TaxID=1883 RepID=UPI002306B272|nr:MULTISPECIES: helix-turn-helix transcriptional regulator [Streptomyces]WCD94628.1 helix-turn-helix transcriptional regulator [Streptomyces sp. HUAS 31]WSZ71923.1 helix-turn-helix transcriptional regulator [Streptomyces chartreusis]WTA25097.1 helix-turn-helix transcriptional regulator [Streptomyces chartreusis]WUB15754.1 helix-turn-helix transcriptional regulator [Streptomyces chartreusis]
MSEQAPNEARVIPLRPPAARPPVARPSATRPGTTRPASERPATAPPATAPPRAAPKEPLWRDLVGDVLRRERLAQERTLKDVADAARISMPYLSEVERGRKEASSEVLAAAAHALGLGLGDLLSLAQGELIRVTSRRVPGGSRGRTGSSYDGLCLAA